MADFFLVAYSWRRRFIASLSNAAAQRAANTFSGVSAIDRFEPVAVLGILEIERDKLDSSASLQAAGPLLPRSKGSFAMNQARTTGTCP